MIPIFRAKKLATKNEYAEGFLKNCTDTGLNIFWIQDKDFVDYRIDIDTLAIHFSDMLDSQGNKIFASLQEDGRGGDIILEESRLMCDLKIDESAFREFTAIHTINGNRFTNEKILSDIGSYRDKYFKGSDIMIYDFFMMKKRNIKIIGIQE